MATSTIASRAVQASSDITLCDVIEDIALHICSDGTLLKSTLTFSHDWHDMLLEIINSEQLKGIKGRPAILDQIYFSYNGPTPTSSALIDALCSIRRAATQVGALCDGWFLPREHFECRSEAFGTRSEHYKIFIRRAAEIARGFVSQGNIMDLLPTSASVNRFRRY